MTFEMYTTLEESLTNDIREALMKSDKPADVAGHPVPDNLDGLTLGDLATLQRWDVLEVVHVLTGASAKETSRERADKVIGLLLWVKDEIERISKLFEGTEIDPTPEEMEASAGSKNFGLFGMADWYARRMGLAVHESALKTSWARVLLCRQIDADAERYRRRLRKIYERKQKKR